MAAAVRRQPLFAGAVDPEALDVRALARSSASAMRSPRGEKLRRLDGACLLADVRRDHVRVAHQREAERPAGALAICQVRVAVTLQGPDARSRAAEVRDESLAPAGRRRHRHAAVCGRRVQRRKATRGRPGEIAGARHAREHGRAAAVGCMRQMARSRRRRHPRRARPTAGAGGCGPARALHRTSSRARRRPPRRRFAALERDGARVRSSSRVESDAVACPVQHFDLTELPGGLRVVSERLEPSGPSRSASGSASARATRRARGAASRTSSSTCSSRAASRHDALDIAQLFDGFGGELNAATSKDHTMLYTRVLDDHLERRSRSCATWSPRPSGPSSRRSARSCSRRSRCTRTIPRTSCTTSSPRPSSAPTTRSAGR